MNLPILLYVIEYIVYDVLIIVYLCARQLFIIFFYFYSILTSLLKTFKNDFYFIGPEK